MTKRKYRPTKGKKCRVCGTDKNIEIDHVQALKLGGFDDELNIQFLCRYHHFLKTQEDMRKIRQERATKICPETGKLLKRNNWRKK